MFLPFLFSDRDNKGLCVWDFMKTDRISALKEVNNDLSGFFMSTQIRKLDLMLSRKFCCFYGAGSGMVTSYQTDWVITTYDCAYNNLSLYIVD